jgi:hypothetical protein
MKIIQMLEAQTLESFAIQLLTDATQTTVDTWEFEREV